MKSKNLRAKSSMKAQVRLLPGYILLFLWLIFTIILIGWIVIASLSTTKEIFSNDLLSSGLHFENYQKVIEKQKLGTYFFNSIIYSFSSCFGIIVISAPAAYVMGRFVFKGRKFINNVFVMCMSIPIIMIVLPLFQMATQMQITGSRITLIILYIGTNVPFSVFFLTGFFISLPAALEEAATIDGCGPVKTFWKVMFPLAQPGIITLTVFNFITIWNEYFMALIFANKAKLRTVSIGLQVIVQSMRSTGDWATLFAGVVVVFLPTFILYLFLSNMIIAGISGGAVKE